ncbi:MAG: hypothetical protein R3F21_09000 [Myxococcota bacterium]
MTESNPFGALFRPPGEGSGQIEIAARNLTIDDADLRTLTVTDEDAMTSSIDLTGDFVARAPGPADARADHRGHRPLDRSEPGQVVTNVLFASYATTDVTILVCGARASCGALRRRWRRRRYRDPAQRAARGRRASRHAATAAVMPAPIRLAVDDSIVFRGLDAFDERPAFEHGRIGSGRARRDRDRFAWGAGSYSTIRARS